MEKLFSKKTVETKGGKGQKPNWKKAEKRPPRENTPQTQSAEVKEKRQLEKRAPERPKKEMKNIEASLDSSRFRLLNEMLYTQSSEESQKYFSGNNEAYKIYHEGFSQQTARWSHEPVKIVAEYIKSHRDNLGGGELLDLGCGTGQLEILLKDTGIYKAIHSYDLVQTSPHVQICDIKNVPRPDHSASTVVFCLSLMGTNYIDFIVEANRLLKSQGHLIIAEVTSRFSSPTLFTVMMVQLGFQQIHTEDLGTHFNLLVYKKRASPHSLPSAKCTFLKDKHGQFRQMTLAEFSKMLLKPCIYKRR